MSIVNKNNVELLGWYGGDRRVCLSAWQSTTDELGLDISGIPENARIDEIFKHLSTQKKKTPFELLEMLASHNHGTPFEKVFVDFQITADIASHIHALKHRISHINSESARYKELIDKGHSLTIKTKAMQTLIYAAIKNRSLEKVQLLVENGYAINQDDQCIYWAAFYQNYVKKKKIINNCSYLF